jgi:hypothetical protein
VCEIKNEKKCRLVNNDKKRIRQCSGRFGAFIVQGSKLIKDHSATGIVSLYDLGMNCDALFLMALGTIRSLHFGQSFVHCDHNR